MVGRTAVARNMKSCNYRPRVFWEYCHIAPQAEDYPGCSCMLMPPVALVVHEVLHCNWQMRTAAAAAAAGNEWCWDIPVRGIEVCMR